MTSTPLGAPPFALAFGAGAATANDEPVHYRAVGGAAVSDYDDVELHWQNQALLNALAEIDRIQQGMRLTPAIDGRDLLREARAGGMYGFDPGS